MHKVGRRGVRENRGNGEADLPDSAAIYQMLFLCFTSASPVPAPFSLYVGGGVSEFEKLGPVSLGSGQPAYCPTPFLPLFPFQS
jgi:hypothetical protein